MVQIDLITGFLILVSLIIFIIIYLVLLNIVKIILSVKFIGRLVSDFKNMNKGYEESKQVKRKE